MNADSNTVPSHFIDDALQVTLGVKAHAQLMERRVIAKPESAAWTRPPGEGTMAKHGDRSVELTSQSGAVRMRVLTCDGDVKVRPLIPRTRCKRSENAESFGTARTPEKSRELDAKALQRDGAVFGDPVHITAMHGCR